MNGRVTLIFCFEVAENMARRSRNTDFYDKGSRTIFGTEEDYLELFSEDAAAPGRGPRLPDQEDVEPGFSHYVASYPKLDQDSGVGLVRLSSEFVPASWTELTSETSTLICCTLRGEGELAAEGTRYSCGANDCILLDHRHARLRSLPGSSWECAFIRIHGRLESRFCTKTARLLREEGIIKLSFGPGSRPRSLVRRMVGGKDEKSQASEEVYAHLLLALFVEIELILLGTGPDAQELPELIGRIKSYLDENYAQSLSLDILSAKFNVSKFHMSREFKKYVGKSPNDYLIDRRLERARELLLDSDAGIAEIAAEVGVPNTNHFLYLFKKREGMTPTAYRKQQT